MLITHSLSATFSGGVRSCIGWRFAYVNHLLRHSLSRGTLSAAFWDRVLEMQAFLVTLIRKFDISHADHQPQIKRNRPGIMAPFVLGEEYKGVQLPLKITTIPNV